MMKRMSIAGTVLAAIFGISLVAVSSASADYYQCYLVSNPVAGGGEKGKEGAYNTNACTKPTAHLLEGKWILALLLNPTVENLWCALIRLVLQGNVSGEDGAYEDEKCTKKLTGTNINRSNYTEVTVPEEDPKILPIPTTKEPLLLTLEANSVKNILQAAIKIECKEVAGESSFISPSFGTGVLTLTGCENASGKCFAPSTEPHGTIKLNVVEQLVDILPEKVLSLGVAIGPAESPLKITCGSATIEVEGAAIGEITGAKSGEKVKKATLTFTQKEGIQTFTTCDIPESICTSPKISLESKFNTMFEEAGEESTDTITVAKTEKQYEGGAAFDY